MANLAIEIRLVAHVDKKQVVALFQAPAQVCNAYRRSRFTKCSRKTAAASRPSTTGQRGPFFNDAGDL